MQATLNKKRVNAFVVGGDVGTVEFWLAINGVKAIGFTDGNTGREPFDWEMERRGAASDLAKACDVIIAGDAASLAAAKAHSVRTGITAYSFLQRNDTADMQGFTSCVKACRNLLGRDSADVSVLFPENAEERRTVMDGN